MAKTPAHSGPHKYIKVKWGKNGTIVWRCILRNCMHYLHDEFVEGKLSLCHKCGGRFTMNKDKMRRTKPKCDNCQTKGPEGVGKLDSLLHGL